MVGLVTRLPAGLCTSTLVTRLPAGLCTSTLVTRMRAGLCTSASVGLVSAPVRRIGTDIELI